VPAAPLAGTGASGRNEPDTKPRGKVVDLRPQIERSRWKAKHLWEVTKRDIVSSISLTIRSRAVWSILQISSARILTIATFPSISSTFENVATG
jgi:hypothetical protein